MKKNAYSFVLTIFLALAAMAGQAQTQEQSQDDAARVLPGSQQQVQLSYAPVVRQVAPAVVNVRTKQVPDEDSPMRSDPYYRRFFGDEDFRRFQRRPQGALGSGVIVRAQGIVVTNFHVIRNADVIQVALADRREFEAEVLIRDERTDLAVLRIESDDGDFPYAELGDADDLQVGDIVLALGNPFGVGQTVTSGIVSALARTSIGVTDYRFFIQTDAAVNPGNSGGALATLDGKVVGINTAIFSRTGGSVGIGFAIPANMVARVVDAALRGEELNRPWMGAVGQTVTPEIAESIGLGNVQGVIVQEIFDDSPAEEAGLREGDVIVKINGRPVIDGEGMRFRLATLPPRGTAELSVLRDTEEVRLELPLRPAPEDPPRNVTLIRQHSPLQGAEIANLSPGFAEELGIRTVRGVIVLRLQRGSVTHRLGFRPGDIILSVNGENVSRVSELQDTLKSRRGGWEMRIRRGEQVFVQRFRP